MNTSKSTTRRRTTPFRQGFTLVEMLISVTLVLLMMTMFTAIFQMATNSISVQRGISENDKRARALTTVLRADIAKRSFRYVQPFYPTELDATSPTPFGNRAGYIYISTNDPESWQDDLLQFTVDVGQSQEDTDNTQYFGAAKLLYYLAADPDFLDGPRRTSLLFNPNQPDADDADLFANEVSASSAAEISYFVRNGNLFRRVMLLREPLPVAGEDLATQPSPSFAPVSSGTTPEGYVLDVPAAGSGSDFGGIFAYVASPLNINQTVGSDPLHFALAAGDVAPAAWNVTATNDFWGHFDFAATPNLQPDGSGNLLPDGLSFVGINALDNTSLGIGNPANRFGFNSVTGLSREHDNTTNGLFIGRYLHAETSHPDFNWPLAACRTAGTDVLPVNGSSPAYGDLNSGSLIGNGNPMDLVGTPLFLNRNGVLLDDPNNPLSGFAGTSGRGGPRMVEDLLLANVHGMKIEIWDDRLQRYVTPSHNGRTQISTTSGLETIAGDYSVWRNANTTYGPLGTIAPTQNHVFDTWHAQLTTAGGPNSPPFVAYRYYPPQLPAGPSPASPITDPSSEPDRETGRVDNRGYWEADTNYAIGDVVFAVPEQFVVDGVVGWNADTTDPFDWVTDQATASGPFPSQGFQIAYRCVNAGASATLPPTWPRAVGQQFSESTGVQWVSIDNRRPLKSIRVTVQFFDQNTETLRQLKLVLPMTTDR